MGKAKLNVGQPELDQFMKACEKAALKVLETQQIGQITTVVVKFKTEQELFTTGRFMERVNGPGIPEPLKINQSKLKQKKNVKTKQNSTKQNG